MAAQIDQRQLAEELVAQARADAVQLIGEGGLLTGLTKSVLECAVEEETPPAVGDRRIAAVCLQGRIVTSAVVGRLRAPSIRSG